MAAGLCACNDEYTFVPEYEVKLPTDTTINVTIDASTVYQTIDGFASSDAWDMEYVGKYWSTSNKEAIAKLLFSREVDDKGNSQGIGLSMWRFNLGGGSEEQGDASGIVSDKKERRVDCFLTSANGSYDWYKSAGRRYFMEKAKEYGCESIAFPLISSGIYGYPKDKALKIATDTITAFLENNDMQAYIVVFDKRAYQISSKLYADIAEYIDDHYVDIHDDQLFYKLSRKSFAASESFGLEETPICGIPAPSGPSSLEEAVNQLDESFSEMLLRKIDEKGMTDSQCYKNANIDRKLFSKIRNDKFYKPRKTTVLAFALALELPLAEIKEMLEKAGFALSRSNKADVIVEYFIQQGNYNVFEINEALFAFDQQLIGA